MRKVPKVWGTIYTGGRGEGRTVVATTSKAKAAAAIGLSSHQGRRMLDETTNGTEMQAALSKPGTPFRWLKAEAGKGYQEITRK